MLSEALFAILEDRALLESRHPTSHLILQKALGAITQILRGHI